MTSTGIVVPRVDPVVDSVQQGKVTRIDEHYAYIEGCPQALRVGYDISSQVEVGWVVKFVYAPTRTATGT